MIVGNFIATIRRGFQRKYAWWLVLVGWGILSFFGVPLPKDWNTTASWLLSIDIWVLNHAAYPGLFLVFVGLALGTVVGPEVVRLLASHLRAEPPHHGSDTLTGQNLSDPTGAAIAAMLEKKQRQEFGVEVRSNALRVTLGETADFVKVQVHQDHLIRTVFACVENIDTAHFISNCKIEGEFNGGTHLLIDSFTLNATEKRFVPIATHHEAPFDQFIHIEAPRAGGFFAEAYDYLKLPLSGALITIKATSAETRPAQLICHLFIDASGKLKLEKA
jgi:hypothetical protein